MPIDEAPRTAHRLFIGRESERGSLANGLETALAGRGSLILVWGEAGIGKSALVEEHLREARSLPVTAVWSRSFETDASPPYGSWLQLLHRLARSGYPPATSALRRWLGGTGRTDDVDRVQLFEMVTSHLVDSARERALVLVLEDLQWSDISSVALLRHLADDLSSARLQVIATYRREPLDEPSRAALLHDLERLPAARAVDLTPLRDAEVARYLDVAFGDRLTTQARANLIEWAGGNAFFMTELSRLVAAGVDLHRLTGSLRDLVGRRLSTVPQPTADLLRAAAVIGREFDLRVLALVETAPVEVMGAQLDPAVKAGLITTIDAPAASFRFRQELVREALYQDLPLASRQTRHRQVAEAIEELWGSDLDDHLAELSYHWMRTSTAGESEKGVGWTLRAAEHAVNRLAFEEAVRLYQAALRLPSRLDRTDLLLRLAVSQHRAGDVRGAFETCRRIVQVARAQRRPDLLAEAALVLQGIGDPELAPDLAEMSEEALAGLDTESPALRARLLGQLSTQLAYVPDHDRMLSVSAEALEVASHTDDVDALVVALRSRQLAVSGPDGVGERLSLADRMAAIGSSTRQPQVTLWGRLWRIDALLQIADLPGVQAERAELERLVQRLGQPIPRWHLIRLDAALAALRGEFETAILLADEARDLGRRGGHGVAAGHWMAFRVQLAALTGTASGAEELLARRLPVIPFPIQNLSAATALLIIGREDEARAQFQAGLTEFASHPMDFQWLPAASLISDLARHFEDKGAAEFLYPRLQPFRGQLAVPGAGPPVVILGCVSLRLGQLASLLGDDAAQAYFEEAIAIHDRIGAQPYAAISRFELARHLAASARARQAHRFAAAALATATELGMKPLAGEACNLVEETSGQASPLSRRESEVAEHVARGLSNKQIAAALFLSERTVDAHVRSILGKLGFRSRSQVAAWAAERDRKN